MEFRDAALLLDPRPLHLEMGIERLASGVLHVAARTDMHGCSGAMVDWWLRWMHTTQHYVWWHPVDHVSSSWSNWTPGRYVGATNIVDEKLSGEEVHHLHIHFIEPAEMFGADELERRLADGSVSAAICATTGADEPMRDDQGRPVGGRMTHVARDTPFGCVLRSHFWLGEGLPDVVSPEMKTALFTDQMGLGLMRHAYNEFTFLSRLLPSLYVAENRDLVKPALPWGV